MYEQYRSDPDSVAESWREFFEDYRSVSEAAHPSQPVPEPAATAPVAAAAAPALAAPAPAQAAPAPAPAQPEVVDEPGELIKGVSAVIVRNMAASLEVPTATSFRNVPAKLLEVNRKVINGYRARSGPARSASPT